VDDITDIEQREGLSEFPDKLTRRHRFLTARQVRDRYGGMSTMWLWRHMTRDPDFPKPIKLGKRNLFFEEELDAFDEKLMEERNDG
jgi:predicted DNA-binding transcriptional regulator AlpA